MKDVRKVQATLHLLATAIASRAGCIHTVESDGSEVVFDTMKGGRGEFAKHLLRSYLDLPPGTDELAAADQYCDKMAAAPASEITPWEVLFFTLCLLTARPYHVAALNFPDGLTVTTDPHVESPTYHFACDVLDRYFGEGAE